MFFISFIFFSKQPSFITIFCLIFFFFFQIFYILSFNCILRKIPLGLMFLFVLSISADLRQMYFTLHLVASLIGFKISFKFSQLSQVYSVNKTELEFMKSTIISLFLQPDKHLTLSFTYHPFLLVTIEGLEIED